MSAPTLQDRLAFLLADLESNQLVTVLVPQKRYTNEGGCIRVNVSVPPSWYRRLCRDHTSKRGTRRGKQDTVIRRHRIIQTLTTMSEGRKPRSIYAEELRRIAAGVKL